MQASLFIRQNGALDEWLSQRSAKPSTAVRIRQAPHKESDESLIHRSLYLYTLHTPHLHRIAVYILLEDIIGIDNLVVIKPLAEFLFCFLLSIIVDIAPDILQYEHYHS